MATRRAAIELRLTGLPVADGEIPLTQLSEIARHAQELALRTARALADSAGPGRTSRIVEERAQLTLSSLKKGSTILKLAGPEREDQLPLGGDFEDADDVFRALGAAFEHLSRGAPPPISRPALESLTGLLRAAGQGGTELQVTTRIPGKRARRSQLVPLEAVAVIESSALPVAPRSEPVALSGELYRVDTHSGNFRIEDDLGTSIEVRVAGDPRRVGSLVGQRVAITGAAEYDGGRIARVIEAIVSPASPIEGLDAGTFRRPLPLGELLMGAEPFDPDEPGIEGVDADEVEALVAAIRA